MASFARQLTVGYTPQQMYELVDDIDSYPEFLPWCESARVSRAAAGKVEASLGLRKGPLAHSFTTANVHDAKALTIAVRLKRGPLHSLVGKWHFAAAKDDGCTVRFEIRYQFANRILEHMLGPLFAHVYENMVEAFAKRARQVYGRR